MSSQQPAQQKRLLRRDLKQQRLALSTEQVNSNSKTIVKKLIQSDLWSHSQHIGLYLPINNEVDLRALFNTDKTLYVPAIQGQKMQFHPHQSTTKLPVGPFGIQQPEFQINHTEPVLDLCLLPLLGFDAQGNRLGMGGGFYDRYFAHNPDTMLLGVAHNQQQYEELPIEPWDVKLHSILTELQWLIL